MIVGYQLLDEVSEGSFIYVFLHSNMLIMGPLFSYTFFFHLETFGFLKYIAGGCKIHEFAALLILPLKLEILIFCMYMVYRHVLAYSQVPLFTTA